jgi:hypothetical protein
VSGRSGRDTAKDARRDRRERKDFSALLASSSFAFNSSVLPNEIRSRGIVCAVAHFMFPHDFRDVVNTSHAVKPNQTNAYYCDRICAFPGLFRLELEAVNRLALNFCSRRDSVALRASSS